MLIPNEPPSAQFSPQCDGPMDGPTDRRTDTASHRVACLQLKRKKIRKKGLEERKERMKWKKEKKDQSDCRREIKRFRGRRRPKGKKMRK